MKFWRAEIVKYQKWYRGELPELFRESSPSDEIKIFARNEKDSAILTWLKVHQEKKYMEDLELPRSAFSGMKLLDIGAGPMPSACVFENCEVYNLDPLLGEYVRLGFPLHYSPRAHFICAPSEDIPVEDGFFDAIISVNAIDHVDDLHRTAQEIKRVLKPGGKLRMHVHYHPKTDAEPIEIDDDLVHREFGWCSGLAKIGTSKKKRGFDLKDHREIYTLWSN